MPEFSLERSIDIKAPAASVFSNVKDFRNWEKWSPWILAEPTCQIDYAEDGRGYSWSGDIIGAGKMEVTNVVEGESIHYRLTFLKPFESTSSVSFSFRESNGKTTTSWSMSGSLPFFLFWMRKMMVATISMDYDRGLLMLKDQVELGRIPSTLSFPGIESVDGFEYLGLSRECQLSEVSDLMTADYEKASALAKDRGLEVTEAPVSFYEKFKLTKGRVRYKVALPVPAGSPCPEGLEKGRLPSLRGYAIHHTGPYRHLGNAWAAGMMHQRAKLFTPDKSIPPFEIYVNDPVEVAEEDLRSIVVFPAK